jgi:DNA polymerase-3 subunit gamma/tau
MSFLVTARKYRPASFTEIVAQDHVVHTLLNSIRLNRIAHAYLFCGPRGVGKTTTARIFAKALNCPNTSEGEPCNACDTCVEISEGRSIDVIEIDGASNNGVDQVRSIRDSVRFMPVRDRFKLYIIDEVHMLTDQAFNALLKTLEEPPAHALFIFATTEPHKLLPTVLSRCQRHDFKRITIENIVKQLKDICGKEGIAAADNALFAIAKKGDGSMRDSESIFDQVVAYSGNEMTYETVREVLHLVDEEVYFRMTELIASHDSKGGFMLADDVVMSGHDIQDFLVGLEEHFRNLLVVRSTGESRLIEASEETRARYALEAGRFPEGDLLRLLKLTADTMQAIKYSPQPRLKFEIALIAMIKMDSTILISDLLAGSGTPPQSVARPKTEVSRPQTDTARSAPVVPPLRTVSTPKESTSAAGRTTAGISEHLARNEDQYATLARGAVAATVQNSFTAPAPSPSFSHDEHPPMQPATPPHPYVQMLIDGLGAVILPDRQ